MSPLDIKKRTGTIKNVIYLEIRYMYSKVPIIRTGTYGSSAVQILATCLFFNFAELCKVSARLDNIDIY